MKMFPLLSLTFLIAGLDSFAEDWPGWGGKDPGRNMYSSAKNLPDHFAKEMVNGKIDFKPGTEEIDRKSAKNLKWVAKIGSQSYGKVTVDRGKPTERRAPPAKIGPKDADIIWRFDMMDELGVFPHNASNCSVLIVDDLVYVCTSNGQDWTHSNIPSPLSPSFIALDKKTGELRGEDEAHIGPKIFHGQWSSPSTGKVNGRQLIFFGGGDGWCYAFDAKPVKEGDTSFLKVVWKYDCNPPEYKKNDPAHKYPA